MNHDMGCPPLPHSPWRTPLNSIPDPSQIHHSSPKSPYSKDHFPSKQKYNISPEPPPPLLDTHQQNVSTTKEKEKEKEKDHRVGNNRGGKVNSEPNSAQNTPAKALVYTHRVSNVGGKGASCSRVPRVGLALGLSQIANPEPLIDVPHFELTQDHSFWKDYNVQVL